MHAFSGSFPPVNSVASTVNKHRGDKAGTIEEPKAPSEAWEMQSAEVPMGWGLGRGA